MGDHGHREDCRTGGSLKERRFSAALRLSSTCPECGGGISLREISSAFRCPFCEAALLALHDGPRTAAVPFLVPVEAAALRLPGLQGDLTPIFVPYEEAAFRLFELGFGLEDGGASNTIRLGVQRADLQAPCVALSLDLPERARSAWIAAVKPFNPAKASGALVIASDPAPRGTDSGGTFESLRSRLLTESIVRGVVPLTRVTRATLLSRTRLYFPFYLGRDSEGALLVDGMVEAPVLRLTGADAERLERPEAPEVPGAVHLESMRCLGCRAALPLSRPFCARVCATCGAVTAASESALERLPREVDLQPGEPDTGLVPVWRFPFVLTDPRDGAGLDSVSAVTERLGGRRAESGVPGLDVPAFLEADGAEASPVYQDFPSLAPRGSAHPSGPEPPASAFRPALLSAEDAREIARLVIAQHAVAGALTVVTGARLTELVLEAPLELGAPKLVFRAR